MEQKDHQQASDKIAAHYALAVPSTFLIRIGRLWSTASTPRSAYSLNMPSGQPTSSWSATAFSRAFGESAAARIPAGLPYRTIFLLPTAIEDRLGAELWGLCQLFRTSCSRQRNEPLRFFAKAKEK